MITFILGVILIIAGAFAAAVEARPRAYERKTVGPILALAGLAYVVGAGIDALF